MHPLLSKRSNPSDLQGFPAVSPACLPGHRRLRARATVRMIPASIRKGSQVFRKPAQLDQTEETRKNEEKSMEVVTCKKETEGNVIFQ